ncbi:hypothetical protein GCM10022240_03750 [Microbacterium kribbense]|uniref:Uncharacterized protein n=1 Tax=Microbacterium kribbense TaxID=433645 RepID=A0ABP7G7Y6_9MICO
MYRTLTVAMGNLLHAGASAAFAQGTPDGGGRARAPGCGRAAAQLIRKQQPDFDSRNGGDA